ISIIGVVQAAAEGVSGSVTLPSNVAFGFAGLRAGTARSDRLLNLSSRARVGSGDRVLITGFVIGGDADKAVLLRAVGPSLAGLGVSAPLANPRLRVYRQGTLVLENDDWAATGGEDLAAAMAAIGAFELAELSRD